MAPKIDLKIQIRMLPDMPRKHLAVIAALALILILAALAAVQSARLYTLRKASEESQSQTYRAISDMYGRSIAAFEKDPPEVALGVLNDVCETEQALRGSSGMPRYVMDIYIVATYGRICILYDRLHQQPQAAAAAKALACLKDLSSTDGPDDPLVKKIIDRPSLVAWQRHADGLDATGDAVRAQLQNLRTQIELYKTQHNNQYPTTAQLGGAKGTWDVLVHRTQADGSILSGNPVAGTTYFGPYIATPAMNPFNDSSTVAPVTSFGVGWQYNETTGALRICAPAPAASSAGLKR